MLLSREGASYTAGCVEVPSRRHASIDQYFGPVLHECIDSIFHCMKIKHLLAICIGDIGSSKCISIYGTMLRITQAIHDKMYGMHTWKMYTFMYTLVKYFQPLENGISRY